MSLSNTGIDRFLQQNYYSKTQLNAGQLDSRYYAESEFLATSEGAGDAGKPVKLNGSGALDATLYASSVVTLTGTQTLTNKTLTAPTITNPTVTGVETVAASLYSGGSFSAHTAAKAMNVWGAGTDGTRFWAAALGMNVYWDGTNWKVGGDGSTNGGVLFLAQGTGADWSTYTFPSTGTTAQIIAPGSLSTYLRSTVNASAVPVTTSGTQTLTAKTLTAPVISTISNTGTLTLPTSTDTLVGRATTDTLTNKTLTAPVISTISNTGTLTLPTSTDTLVGRATTDTLTNKTLTAPNFGLSNWSIGTLTTNPLINWDNNDYVTYDRIANQLNFVVSSTTVIGVTASGLAVTGALSASTTFSAATSATTPTLYGGSAANADLTLEGTSSATKTSSTVYLQPTGGTVGVGFASDPGQPFAVRLNNSAVYISPYNGAVDQGLIYAYNPATPADIPMVIQGSYVRLISLSGSRYQMYGTFTPTGSADATGTEGDVSFDASYMYRKTAAGWKRAALSTF